MAAAQLPEFPPFTFLSFGRHVSDGDIGVPRLRRGVEQQWRSEFLTAIRARSAARHQLFVFSDCGENLCRHRGGSLYGHLLGMVRCQRNDPDAPRVDAPHLQLRDDYQGRIH